MVWHRISKLALELYNSQFLVHIGYALGTMLKVDTITSIHSWRLFARIFVEVNSSEPLVPHIMIRGHHLPIEYEGLHQIAFSEASMDIRRLIVPTSCHNPRLRIEILWRRCHL